MFHALAYVLTCSTVMLSSSFIESHWQKLPFTPFSLLYFQRFIKAVSLCTSKVVTDCILHWQVYVKLLPVTRWQEFAETLIALIVAERCTIEGQKALTQTTLAQQLMGV